MIREKFIFDLQRFAFSGGSGTADDPYLISTVADLNKLASDVNGGNSYGGKHFKLTKDIDMRSVANFAMIGLYDGDTYYWFKGTFDGDGHTISNLTINKTNDDCYVGLFGLSKGTIKNLTLKDANIVGYREVGGIVGYNFEGTVENCFVTGGTVRATGEQSVYASGIVSLNEGTVRNCSVTGVNISGGDEKGEASGIVGYNKKGTVRNCSVTSANISGNYYAVGGIVSMNEDFGTIENCFVTNSTISGQGGVGGIVGRNEQGTVKTCLIANNTVTGGDIYGINRGNVGTCYYYGDKEYSGLTRAYKITLPEGVTASGTGVIFIGRIAYAPKDASVTITMTSGIPKIGGKPLGKNNDGTYFYTMTEADITLEASTPSLLDNNLDVDRDGNYLIKSLDDLNTLASHVNDGNGCAGLTFKLVNDIDMKDVANFTAIGKGNNTFRGTFDGGGHTISNSR